MSPAAAAARLAESASETPMPIRVLSYKPINKLPVLGVADAVLGKSLEIFSILIMQSGDSVWCSFPGKPQIGADGKVMKDDRGKVKYTPVLKWADRVLADRFKDALLEGIASVVR
jgi:hypothetical protein